LPSSLVPSFLGEREKKDKIASTRERLGRCIVIRLQTSALIRENNLAEEYHPHFTEKEEANSDSSSHFILYVFSLPN
jgi:hypothetical protein